MTIDFIDLNPTYSDVRSDVQSAVADVLDSGQYIDGPAVADFEEAVADYLDVDHAVGVSSGSDALYAALRACGVGEGDEVVTTPFTFVASVEAICRAGARPVFADVDPVTANLDPASVADVARSAIDGPDALLPVHLFGQPCRMDDLLDVADTHDLAVVEDAAQAIGARVGESGSASGDGDAVGTLGDAGCFSFYPTKNLGGFGDGGLVTTDSPELADRVRSLARHGRDDEGQYAKVGGNFRLDALQAAALHAQLPHLDDWNAERRRLAATYDDLFADCDAVDPVGARRRERESTRAAPHLYCVRAHDRAAVTTRLDAADVGWGVYYDRPVYDHPAYRQFAPDDPHPGCPAAERLADEILALPLYPGLTDKQLNRVAAAVINRGVSDGSDE